ncbi:MAG: mechanosensitive ion channel [Vicingaceae bacterium]
MNLSIKEILQHPTYGKLIFLFIGLVIIWVIIKTIQKALFKKIEDNTNKYRTNKFTQFIGYFLSIILITFVYSEKLGGLTVAFGVAGAGIAFALQEVIVSFAGWIGIMSGRFYKIGDRVQLGNVKGDVIDIGVFQTTLMEIGNWIDGDLYNGRIVVLSNSIVFKEPVFNYSRDFPFLWDEIKIPIMYGSNYDMAKKIIIDSAYQVVGEFSKNAKKTWKEMVGKFMIEDATTDPFVTLIATDNWMEYTLRYPVDFKSRRKTKDQLFTLIVNNIEASNNEIKLASATFQLVEPPVFNVKINN